MIQKLIDTFGEDLVKYIFAIPTEKPIPKDETKLDKETFDFLVKNINYDSFGFSPSLSILSRYCNEGGSTVLKCLNIKNGGIVDETINNKNKLLNTLYQILIDIWPIYLYSPSNLGQIHSSKKIVLNSAVFFSLYDHPLIGKVCKLFMEDIDLKKMFDGTDISKLKPSEYVTISSEWITSAGNGGTQQILSAISSLFYQTLSRCIIVEGKINFTLLCKYLDEVVKDWKKLANRKEVMVFTLYGLEGFTVDPGIVIKCNNATIRTPTKYELNTLLDYDVAPQLVIETQTALKLDFLKKNNSHDEINKWYEKHLNLWTENFDKQQKELNKIKLSLVLVSNLENNSFIVVNENSKFSENPIQNSSQLFGEYKFYKPTGGHLTKEMAKEVEYWYDKITFNKLNIGIKKLLSAIANRPNPNDAFIDAIIVWENIFGSKTETTFKITASLAKLLEPENEEKRLELQKELQKLYNLRSELVHGVNELPADKAHDHKNRAIVISIKSLKILFEERPDLLKYNSGKRSTIMLLGGQEK